MIESFLKVLGTGLEIWASKEKTKYIDKYMSLKKDWYEEINKPEDQRSAAVLDNIRFELELLGAAFSATARTADPVAGSQ